MSSASTHFKLGVLGIVMIVGLIAVVLVFGTERLRRSTIDYTTFFDESVQGLERGALVKYRGVQIGNVDDIEVAPDRKLIAVTLEINKRNAQRLRLDDLATDLRAQLVTQGITGVKLVDLDFVDPKQYPPLELTFEPPERYIPSRPSLLERVATNAETIAQQLPELAYRASSVLLKLDRLLDEVRKEQLPTQLAATLRDASAATQELRRTSRQVSRAELPARTARTLGKLDGAVTKLDGILEQVGGDQGLIASARRATESLGDVGRASARSSDELERTLFSIGEAAQSIREFMEALEREPDMLLKGRARRPLP